MGRQNTLRIDFGAIPNKPNLQKVQTFCAEKLGLKRGEVIRIQNSRALGVTFVTLDDFETANKVCEEHGNGHEMTGSDKKQYPVKISIEDGTVQVKLFDLSDNVSNDDIIEFLGDYGEVRDISEERLGDDEEFAGAYTGTRLVKMVVKENIASWVTIKGELTNLTYFGQRQTCRHCLETAHIGVGCVANKKLFVQKSFADAVKQPAKPVNPKPKPSQPKLPLPPKGNGKKKADQPILPATPAKKPTTPDDNATKPTDEGNGSSSLMPPPPGVLPSGSGLSDNSLILQPHAGGGALCKPASGKSDGNDTDSSTSSRRSLRNKHKKTKYNDGNEQEDEEEEL